MSRTPAAASARAGRGTSSRGAVPSAGMPRPGSPRAPAPGCRCLARRSPGRPGGRWRPAARTWCVDLRHGRCSPRCAPPTGPAKATTPCPGRPHRTWPGWPPRSTPAVTGQPRLRRRIEPPMYRWPRQPAATPIAVPASAARWTAAPGAPGFPVDTVPGPTAAPVVTARAAATMAVRIRCIAFTLAATGGAPSNAVEDLWTSPALWTTARRRTRVVSVAAGVEAERVPRRVQHHPDVVLRLERGQLRAQTRLACATAAARSETSKSRCSIICAAFRVRPRWTD